MNYANVNETIRQRIVDNLPAGINLAHVKWPNTPFDTPNNVPSLAVFIEYDGREGVTVGTREYRPTGTVSLTLYSPLETHTVSHDTLADQLMAIFDDVSVQATNVTIEFDPSELLGSAPLEESKWSSVIATPFYYHEYS